MNRRKTLSKPLFWQKVVFSIFCLNFAIYGQLSQPGKQDAKRFESHRYFLKDSQSCRVSTGESCVVFPKVFSRVMNEVVALASKTISVEVDGRAKVLIIHDLKIHSAEIKKRMMKYPCLELQKVEKKVLFVKEK